jgi:hypothetical protein
VAVVENWVEESVATEEAPAVGREYDFVLYLHVHVRELALQ